MPVLGLPRPRHARRFVGCIHYLCIVKRNDNMKLYIISIEDVYDGSSEHKTPIVKTSLEEARQKLTELYDNAVQLYGEQFDTFDKEDNYFEMFEMGYYSQNHYSAVIDEVEIEL